MTLKSVTEKRISPGVVQEKRFLESDGYGGVQSNGYGGVQSNGYGVKDCYRVTVMVFKKNVTE
jgi:hypothetical protein